MIDDLLTMSLKSDFTRMLAQRPKIQEYAVANYDTIISRPTSYILYGPHCDLAGAALPSLRLIHPKVRDLKPKCRRKDYNAYYFDENGSILRVDSFVDGTIDAMTLFFTLDGIRYGQPFHGATGHLYGGERSELYAVMEQTSETRCVMVVSSADLYAEYQRELHRNDGQTMTECTWYRYVDPNCVPDLMAFRLPGTVFSPLQCGVEVYPSFLCR